MAPIAIYGVCANDNTPTASGFQEKYNVEFTQNTSTLTGVNKH
jgi:hypothetical protein